MEIERKFKVLELPKDLESYEKEEIEQGYLCIKPTVRIRKSNDNYFLNYKWKNKNIKENKAIQNIEYEMNLTKQNYEHLLSKIDNNLRQRRCTRENMEKICSGLPFIDRIAPCTPTP